MFLARSQKLYLDIFFDMKVRMTMRCYSSYLTYLCQNLHHVSKLSFLNGVVHTLINVLIMGYCCLRAGDWAFSKVRYKDREKELAD